MNKSGIPSRIRPRLSLRMLFVLTTLCAVLSGSVGIRYRNARMAYFAEQAALRDLPSPYHGYTSMRIVPWDMRFFQRWLNMQYFERVISYNLTGLGLVDSDIKALSHLEELRSLSLGYNPGITDGAIRHVVALKFLENLDLSDTNVTDVGVKDLIELKNIHTLSLSGTNVSGQSMKVAQDLPFLKELYMAGIPTKDSDLESIDRCKFLAKIDVSQSELTDEGLAYIARLPSLSEVYLNDTNITAEGLFSLIENSSLRIVSMVGNDLSASALKQIKSHRPDVIFY